ncbi:hypothetical protein ES703_104505 [subsurface metagenome]
MYLAEAFMDLLFFNKNVSQIKISMKRIGDVPGKNVYITCSGRGALRGSVVDGKFSGIIRGTPKQVRAWQQFFKKFVEVPEFSLKDYIEWLKNNNNNNNTS